MAAPNSKYLQKKSQDVIDRATSSLGGKSTRFVNPRTSKSTVKDSEVDPGDGTEDTGEKDDKAEDVKGATTISHDYDKLAKAAKAAKNPRGELYRTAVQLAKQELGSDAKNVSDNDMRHAVDAHLKKLGADFSGDEARGDDNIFSGIVGGINDGIDGLTSMFGDVTDDVWDTVAGGIGDVFGFGDAARDFYNEDTGKALGDILLDVGLGVIPVAGPWLAAAKNAVQNADNIREAVTGHDSVTGEELTGLEQLGRAGLAALSVGTSAIPGIQAGKVAKSAAGSADDIAKAIANNSGDDLIEAVAKGYAGAYADDAAKAAAKAGAKTAAKEGAETVAKEAAEAAAKEGAEAVAKEGAEAATKEAVGAASKKVEEAAAKSMSMQDAITNAIEAYDKSGGTSFDMARQNAKAMDAVRQNKQGVLQNLSDWRQGIADLMDGKPGFTQQVADALPEAGKGREAIASEMQKAIGGMSDDAKRALSVLEELPADAADDKVLGAITDSLDNLGIKADQAQGIADEINKVRPLQAAYDNAPALVAPEKVRTSQNIADALDTILGGNSYSASPWQRLMAKPGDRVRAVGNALDLANKGEKGVLKTMFGQTPTNAMSSTMRDLSAFKNAAAQSAAEEAEKKGIGKLAKDFAKQTAGGLATNLAGFELGGMAQGLDPLETSYAQLTGAPNAELDSDDPELAKALGETGNSIFTLTNSVPPVSPTIMLSALLGRMPGTGKYINPVSATSFNHGLKAGSAVGDNYNSLQDYENDEQLLSRLAALQGAEG